MKVIGSLESQEIQLDLKYCERCGGLWLRPLGAGGVYCVACQAYFAARPNVASPPARQANTRRKVQMRTRDRKGMAVDAIKIQSQIHRLQVAYAAEVRA